MEARRAGLRRPAVTRSAVADSRASLTAPPVRRASASCRGRGSSGRSRRRSGIHVATPRTRRSCPVARPRWPARTAGERVQAELRSGVQSEATRTSGEFSRRSAEKRAGPGQPSPHASSRRPAVGQHHRVSMSDGGNGARLRRRARSLGIEIDTTVPRMREHGHGRISRSGGAVSSPISGPSRPGRRRIWLAPAVGQRVWTGSPIGQTGRPIGTDL